MKWGIAFSISATLEYNLDGLPEPSSKRRLSSSNGKQTTHIFYHFIYSPQSWKEWQRVAAIKHQIKHNTKGIIFEEYEPSEIEERSYTISELGKNFKAFVEFPKPLFPISNNEAYKMLCRHAKRLVYEDMLHLEQLICTSIRFNTIEGNNEGPRQTIRRAKAAYLFALKHKEKWPVKLNNHELSAAHTKGAYITNSMKKGVRILHSNIARFMYDNGQDLNSISVVLDISKRTIYRYLK